MVLILQNVNSKLGDLKSYKLNGWNKNSRVGVGSYESGTTYTLKYVVTYSNETDNEVLTLFQPSKGDLKIQGIHFDSATLLK